MGRDVKVISLKDNVTCWGFDFFFGSLDLYQDKRNEHKGVFENRMLRYDRFKKVVGTGF